MNLYTLNVFVNITMAIKLVKAPPFSLLSNLADHSILSLYNNLVHVHVMGYMSKGDSHVTDGENMVQCTYSTPDPMYS